MTNIPKKHIVITEQIGALVREAWADLQPLVPEGCKISIQFQGGISDTGKAFDTTSWSVFLYQDGKACFDYSGVNKSSPEAALAASLKQMEVAKTARAESEAYAEWKRQKAGEMK